MYIYMYTYVYIYVYTYTYIHMCVYIHIHIHNGILISHKKNKILPFAATQTDLEGIMFGAK